MAKYSNLYPSPYAPGTAPIKATLRVGVKPRKPDLPNPMDMPRPNAGCTGCQVSASQLALAQGELGRLARRMAASHREPTAKQLAQLKAAQTEVATRKEERAYHLADVKH